MRSQLFPKLWALGLLLPAFALQAQPKPANNSSCRNCSVLRLDPPDGIILVRDNQTGETMEMKTTGTVARNIKPGSPVEADFAAHKITAINGVHNAESLQSPDPAAPCCNITEVKVDPAASCCAVVTATNKETGKPFRFIVNIGGPGNSELARSVIAQLRVGQPVSFDPVDSYTQVNHLNPVDGIVKKNHLNPVDGIARTNHLNPVDGIAQTNHFDPVDGIVFLYLLRNGSTTCYSYPVNGSPATAKIWEKTPNSDLTGMTGRLVIKAPEVAQVLMYIYPSGENTPSDTWHQNNFTNEKLTGEGKLLPGYYDIALWDERVDSIPIEKGMDTRLEVGVLDIDLPGTWKIIDANKKEVFHRSLHEKVMLPVGKYYVVTGKMEQEVWVKDGESTKF